MESIDLDMDDLFDVRGDIDEDAAFPPSPTGFGDNEAPESGGAGGSGGEGEENEEGEIQSQVIQRLRDMSKGAGKRVIRNPQPKLDADRLNGDRGIAILPKIFKDFKLRGPGHEIDDLNVMMRKMEHWAHRLYPKMTFDEVIERVERLGGKKAVQTTIKKIRLDIPLLDEEFGNGEDGEKKSGDEADDRKDESGDKLGYPDEVDLIDSDAENVLDEMIREDSTFTQPVSRTPARKDKPLPSELSTPRDGEPSTPILSQTPQSNTINVTAASPVLTDEVKERIERNKRLALERRQARLKGLTPAKTGTVLTSATPSSQASQVEFSQPSQTLKDSQSTDTEIPKGTEKDGDKKSNDFPSEDHMHLFVDATMDTENHSGATCKSKESGSEEKLHLFVEETMETEKDKDAQSNDSVEKDVQLFIEPTMKTAKSDAQLKSSSEALHLFVEPTIETDTCGSLKETESDPIESAMDDDLHLFMEETAATEKEEQMKDDTKAKEGVLVAHDSLVNETEPLGESGDFKRNSVEKDENEMTEGELHLFLGVTESVSGNTESRVSAGSVEKSDQAVGSQNMTDQDDDEDELRLCIDSTEESQEEEMDTGV